MGIRQVSDNVAIYSGRGYAQLALGYLVGERNVRKDKSND